jgi:hypothetical protein
MILNQVYAAGASSCSSVAVTSTTVFTTATASNGQPSTTADTNIVPIFQFKTQYQLSDMTSDISNRMTTAVANLLQVNTKTVVLSFNTVNLRTLLQKESVLVSVGLVNFQGSTTGFASMITQENIKSEMAAVGLKSVELLSGAPVLSTS